MSKQWNVIRQAFAATPKALFAVLVGSRAEETATKTSDWDIAVLWHYGPAAERVGAHEQLRRQIAENLGISESLVDLIDLSSARLTMRALVAEEGQLLHVNNELAWAKFLIQTWRELESYYWEQAHAD